MLRARFEPCFDSWRLAARDLLAAGVPPEQVLWDDGDSAQPLLAANSDDLPPRVRKSPLRVPAEFIDVAQDVALHRGEVRWSLLYQLLWRISRGERTLMKIEVDPDVRRLLVMQRQVCEDRHRMLGFVRFRMLPTPQGEHYVAWYRPDHHVVRSAAGSFVSRFAVMQWSIFTPDESVHWDGSRLSYSPGVAAVPKTDDEMEDLWRCYYRSTYIPARANAKAIDRHIPRRYRSAMPEGMEIPDLLSPGIPE